MALGALVLLSGCCGTGCKKSECPAQPADDSLMVVLDLHRKVKPESVAAFKASFARCKAATVKEQGCIDYGVYQSPDDSTEFLIYGCGRIRQCSVRTGTRSISRSMPRK